MSEKKKELLEKLKYEKNPFVKARIIKYLRMYEDASIKEISKFINKTPSYVCTLQRLNKIPEIIIDGYESNLITFAHLCIISRLSEEKEMIGVYEKILQNNLSTSSTEEIVRNIKFNVDSQGERLKKELIEKAIKYIKSINPSFSVKLIQTRIKTKLLFELKGSLKETTEAFKKLLEKF